MKILHILNAPCRENNANGVTVAVRRISRQQAALGHMVSVLAFATKEATPIDGVNIITHSPRSTFVPLDLTGKSLLLDQDIVHFHSVHVPYFLVIARMLLKHNVAYCVSTQGAYAMPALQVRRVKKFIYISLFERRFLNQAAFIQVVSENDLPGLKARKISAPTVVVPNGIDIPEMLPQPYNYDVDPTFATTKGTRRLIFVGRLDIQHKGLDLLLKAFAMVRDAGLSLVLVGPSWKDSEMCLRGLALQLGIGDRVIFLGPKYGAEKIALLLGADFFVHTSRWEGLSLSVLEAMALGKPLLLSPAANAGIAIDKAGGGFVAAVDPTAIAKLLEKVAALSASDVTVLGRNAREHASKRFNWSGISRQMNDAYLRYM